EEASAQTAPPPRQVTLAESAEPERAGDLVETAGTVRFVRVESVAPNTAAEALVVGLAAGRERAEVVFFGWGPTRAVPRQWIGASVRVRGVFNAAGPERQQIAAMRLLLPLFRD